MSMFMAGMGARTAIQNIPVAAEAAKKQSSGWDNFLSGAASFAGNYLVGVAAGLSSYDPRNPFSSMGASMLASSRGLQQKLGEPLVEREAAMGRKLEAESAANKREIKRQDMMSMNQTAEDIYRSSADRASVLPDIGGIASGIRPSTQQQPQEESPFGFSLKTFDFGPNMGTAAQRTMGLVK